MGLWFSGEKRYDNNYYYKLTICYPCIVWLLLSQITGNTLPYDELHHIQARLEELAPHLVRYGDMEPANFFGLAHKLVKVNISLKVFHNFLLVPVASAQTVCFL